MDRNLTDSDINTSDTILGDLTSGESPSVTEHATTKNYPAVCLISAGTGDVQWLSRPRWLPSRADTLSDLIELLQGSTESLSPIGNPPALCTPIHFTAIVRGTNLAVKASCLPQTSEIPQKHFVVVLEALEDSPDQTQTLRKVEALNERLKLGMAEAHHRVKNSLQNVIALVGVMSNGAGLDSDQTKKLIAHIRSLASLHDILLDEIRAGRESPCVSLERVFNRLLELTQNVYPGRVHIAQIDSAVVSARRGATLSLILTELIENALKHGSGPIEVSFITNGSRATLSVSNTQGHAASFDELNATKGGFSLIQLLSQADLNSLPAIERNNNVLRVTLTFDIQAVS